jgi:hypothetical protein
MAGVFEDPQTGQRSCLAILGHSDQVAFLSNGRSIGTHLYHGPCGAASGGSHGNADGSISQMKAIRLNSNPGQAGASYAQSQISTVPGSVAAAQVSAGSFYTPP